MELRTETEREMGRNIRFNAIPHENRSISPKDQSKSEENYYTDPSSYNL